MKHFKAYIKVVKSLNKDDYYNFGSDTIIEEKLIIAEDKTQVKKILLDPTVHEN